VFGVGRGTFAEREDELVRKPARLSFEQAAVVAVSGSPLSNACTPGASRRGRRY
jgi:hypothetical protein